MGDINNIKRIWTDKDFSVMGWHDNRFYGFSFDYLNHNLILDIDYIFEWLTDIQNPGHYTGFIVAPCTLIFESCSAIKINFDLKDTTDLVINEIKRHTPRLTPNGKFNEYTYKIILDNGDVEFSSVGFIQKVRELPKIIKNQDLGYGNNRREMFKSPL